MIQIQRVPKTDPSAGSPLAAALSDAADRVRYVLPRGGSLPSEIWERRHRGVIALLLLHAVAIALYGLLEGYPFLHALADAAPVALAALIASRPRSRRIVRASAASLGLIVSSAMLVHLSGGYIEFHFHFFVMVAFIALYQDWIPFLLAVAFVVAHHGALGTLSPESVFNHPDAIAHPWRWAVIHGLFLLAASAAGLIAWRANEYQALHDPLTRLANRALFVDRLENALARAERYGRSVAVLFLDLDHFKSLNDGLGHAAGDEALREAASRLRGCLRRTDTAARLGGDEFAVVLEDFHQEEEAVVVASRIVEALKQPFQLSEREVSVGASVGLCFVDSSGNTADEVMRAADSAMYEAKRKGKSRFAVSSATSRRPLFVPDPA